MPAGGAGGGISNTADWDALVGRMRELRLNEKCKKKLAFADWPLSI